MLRLQNLATKYIFNSSVTNGGTASGTFDTKGYDEVLIIVTQGTSNDTTNNLSVLTIGDGTATNSFADLAGGTGDTDFTIPAADTSNAQTYFIHLDRNKGDWNDRYIKVAASPVTTQLLSAVAILGRARQVPDTTTEQGTALSLNL